MARRITIVREFPKRVGEATAFARFVAMRMNANAYFPSPPVPLPMLLAAAQALEEAEAVARTRMAGTASAHKAKLKVLHGLLDQLATYVVTIAQQRGTDAEAVLASSGFDQKRTAGQAKWVFSVEQGDRSGEMSVTTARAGRGATYDWQYSSDGVHWLDWKRTGTASTVITGLTPGTRVSFRVRSFFRGVTGDWSDPITQIVG